MRQASSRRAMRRQAHGQARAANSPTARVARLVRRTEHLARPAGWVAIVVTLLVSASALLGAGAPTGASATGALAGPLARQSRQSTTLARPASGAPTEFRWRDAAGGTAILLAPAATLAASKAARASGRIEFDLPTGDTVYLAPGQTLVQLEGALLALSPGTAFDQSASDCVGGSLVAAGGAPGVASGARSIIATLQMHVGQFAGDSTLVAYAGLNYSFAPDKTGCGQGAPLYQVLAGCDATSCTPPLPPPAAVQRFDDAMLTAMQNQQWSSVYILTSTSVTTQFTLDQFSAAMAAQVSQQGRITAISPVSAAQVTQQFSNGLQYFSARQSVTIAAPNGNSATRQITSYYLFEGGAWKFWFSSR